jgi:PKHD-type hydroxylase
MLNIDKCFLTNYQSYASYSNAFNEEECKYICSLGWNWKDALTHGQKERNDDVRNSDVFWLEPRNDLMWIWEKMKYYIEEANSHIWRMDLEKYQENMQLTRYKKNGHYDWHMDVGNYKSSFRKLSCVVNLSNEKKYSGGGTLIKVGQKANILPKEQGTLNIFPSYTLHKAKKIKKGTRMSLVCWVGGSHYK